MPMSLYRYGEKCECESTSNNPNLINRCKRRNTSDIICEGHGECLCNECNCDQIEVIKYLMPNKHFPCKFASVRTVP